MPKGVFKRKNSHLAQRMAKMEAIIRSHKKIKFKNLVFEMFGGVRDTDRVKTGYIIGQLRGKLKEQGELFYSIGGYHQIITDEVTFIGLVEATKGRTKENMLSLKKNLKIGFSSFPNAKKDVLRLKNEIRTLLDNPNGDVA